MYTQYYGIRIIIALVKRAAAYRSEVDHVSKSVIRVVRRNEDGVH